ncbi:phage tail protein, partial [Campylobacter jejuni]
MAKSEYYTILTKIGIAKFIAARASGNGINLKSFKLSSKVILPSEEMQSLEEIVYEANINSKSVDESNPNYVNLMCHVPSDVGGFEVNAVGIYDEAGDLLAVGNVPRTYKPILKEGSAKELMIKIVMELSNAEEVILKLDPSVIMASRDYVDAIKVELNLKIDALTQKYDAEFKKVWDEFAKYLLENKFNTEIAKYVTLAT